jgi:hypothetical protein
MAGSAYSVTGAGLTLANQAVTLTWLNPIASPNLDFSFRRFWCGQSATTTYVGNQRIQLNTQVTAFPTVTGATPAKLSNVSGASVITSGTGAAGTSGINASAEGAGAKTVIWADAFSPVNGWLLVLTPDEYIEMGAGSANGLGMHLPVAATTLTNWTVGCTWEEI